MSLLPVDGPGLDTLCCNGMFPEDVLGPVLDEDIVGPPPISALDVVELAVDVLRFFEVERRSVSFAPLTDVFLPSDIFFSLCSFRLPLGVCCASVFSCSFLFVVLFSPSLSSACLAFILKSERVFFCLYEFWNMSS